LTFGKDNGRIWRIVPEGHKTKAVRPNLAAASTAELVKTLEHADGWWRSTAARLLYERNDAKRRDALDKLLASSKSEHARIQAVWLLAKWGEVDGALLHDPNPRVREAALKSMESLGPGDAAGRRAQMLVDDPNPRVRFQVALGLGSLSPQDRAADLVKIALNSADDKWTRLSLASSAADCAGRVLEGLLASKKEFARLTPAPRAALLQEFAALVGARQDAKEVEDSLKALAGIDGTDAFDIQLPAMTGLADGVTRRGGRLADIVDKLPSPEDRTIVKWLAAFGRQTQDFAANAKSEPELRLQAVRYLAHLPLPAVQDVLKRMIEDDPRQEIRMAAVRALAAHPERQVAQLLLGPWKSYTPAVRREVLEALCRDALRINALFDAIEADKLKPGDIDAPRARQLLAHANTGIRERAGKLLRDSLPADRKRVLENYQLVLAMDGDAKRGREIFKKNCATCHKVAGIGIDVGPDIADTRTKTESALLVDILNPNQAIDNNYINYLVTTKSGRILTGLLATETASSITLKRAEGQTDVVLRQDIESIASTGVSLMPEGLEKTIALQEMADLLRFLKNWRYLDGSVPVAK
jgi:putative heme-binding domain-containing protein